jgi:hypothetical protein
MNYTQSFEEFSASLGPTDLALYAGAGIILYVLFKDKLSPVQKMIVDTFNDLKKSVNRSDNVVTVKVPMPDLPKVSSKKQDVFFELVASWKQTRDLSVKSNCNKATELLDETFQYLSPNVCDGKEGDVQ